MFHHRSSPLAWKSARIAGCFCDPLTELRQILSIVAGGGCAASNHRLRRTDDGAGKRLGEAVSGPIAHMELIWVGRIDQLRDRDATVATPAPHQREASEQVDMRVLGDGFYSRNHIFGRPDLV